MHGLHLLRFQYAARSYLAGCQLQIGTCGAALRVVSAVTLLLGCELQWLSFAVTNHHDKVARTHLLLSTIAAVSVLPACRCAPRCRHRRTANEYHCRTLRETPTCLTHFAYISWAACSRKMAVPLHRHLLQFAEIRKQQPTLSGDAVASALRSDGICTLLKALPSTSCAAVVGDPEDVRSPLTHFDLQELIKSLSQST